MGEITRVSGRLPALQWAVASQPLPGESVSGDLHSVCPFQDGILVGVVDALGHGPEAALAARVAVAAMECYASLPLVALFRRCHEVLSKTRGVVAALASINLRQSILTWAAVGNVEGYVFHADHARPRAALLQFGGVVGYRLPKFGSIEDVKLNRGDRLVLATDGIAHTFAEAITPSAPLPDLAESIVRRFAKGSDDALLLLAEYSGAVS